MVLTETKPREIITTEIWNRNIEAFLDGKRRALNEGGTSSSKTYSILQCIIYLADSIPNTLWSVVSESLPHLKRGCIRDFFKILDESPDSPNWNKTECRYTRPNGSEIEFFGADEVQKSRGPRRYGLFINEGNNVPWQAAQNLDARTEKFTFVDWNPTSEFWAHEYWLEKKGDTWVGRDNNVYIHSTYLDAKAVLPQSVVDNIEANRLIDPNWWNIYGLGLIGKIEGLVYPYFEIVDELPQGDYIYGLDFGFAGDEAALGRHILRKNEDGVDSVYSQQLIYEKHLTNQDLSNRMSELGLRKHGAEIWADSAEPKSIEELRREGWNIHAVEKGPGSVEWRRQKTRALKQYWTKDSTDAIKEQRNFRYVEDKLTGRLTEKTTHQFSHLMDERDYAVSKGKFTTGVISRRTVKW